MGQGLEDHVEVGIVAVGLEDRLPRHAVDRLEHARADLLHEGAQLAHVAAHPRGRTALGEVQGVEFFVGVAQAARAVDHHQAGALGQIEHQGVVHERGVDRRVLARQEQIQLRQPPPARGAQFKPGPGIVAHAQWRQSRPGLAVAQAQVAAGGIVQRMAPALRFEQHREGRILLDLERADRIHQHAHGQRHFQSIPRQAFIVAQRAKSEPDRRPRFGTKVFPQQGACALYLTCFGTLAKQPQGPLVTVAASRCA